MLREKPQVEDPQGESTDARFRRTVRSSDEALGRSKGTVLSSFVG